MTKSELIAALAARYTQLAARDTDYAVKTVLDAMTEALAEGQRIEIRGFGSLSIREKKYAGQDKRYNTIYFRMSRNVRDALK